MDLPGRILFVDVMTTGLYSSDRVVDLGAIQLETASLPSGNLDLQLAHYVFDPGKKSQPRAEKAHGYSDWTLRHQDPFARHAGELRSLFEESDLIVAHNAGFDQRFLEHEFARANMPLSERPFYCTMQHYREKVGGRAGLHSVLAQIGVSLTATRHDAFEEAWMAMQVFLWLHDLPRPPGDLLPGCEPINFRAVPPQPEGALPRRKRASASAEAATPAEPAAARPSVSEEERERLYLAARETAVLMMWIACSDGVVDEEIESVFEMVGATMQRLGFETDLDLQQDIAAALIEIDATAELVDEAARKLRGDAAAAGELGRWLNLVTYADGRSTEPERLAVARITEAFAKCRS